MDLLVASKTKIENFDIFNRNVRSVIVKAKFRQSYTLRGRCHSDNLNVPACNKCIRIKMSRNEYASWLLSVIGEPCNSQLRICDIYITCFYSNEDESN